MKRSIRALSLGACALSSALLVSTPADARIVINALGGEVEIEGFLSSEARARVGSGEAYLNQWIQRLQIEPNINYKDVGPFQTLSFNAVIRPEFDAAYYYGDTFGSRGRGSNKPSYLGYDFSGRTDPVGFGGFDFVGAFVGQSGVTTLNSGAAGAVFSTGGVGKIVTNGLQAPSWIDQNFQSILSRTPGGNKFDFVPGKGSAESGFPLFAVTSQMPLNCRGCQNLDNDPLDVAMNNTDSNSNIYPFRELYVDATAGDWWFRVGKQQIVWGKTDFFRLQDIVNPVDFGQHFFFDSFEDIRIPQWMASIQYKAGDIGPTTDNAIQFVWNFDRFKPVGLGNPSQGWAHPFAMQKSTFAGFNQFFSVEPCLGPNYLNLLQSDPTHIAPSDFCGSAGPNDPRSPSGFGQPVGLSAENRPDWKIEHTQGGLRWEFRFGEVHIALSNYSGYGDIPVFRFHSINIPNGVLGASAANVGTQDNLIYDLVCVKNPASPQCNSGAAALLGGTGQIPVRVVEPGEGLAAAAAAGFVPAQQALAANDASLFYNTGAVLGGQVDIQYKRRNTTGLSFDYFEGYTGTVLRVESSWTLGELVNNTRKANWVDKSDVMRWSIGIDRPTWIKWLNKNRTFFLSMQMFDTWYLNHEGGTLPGSETHTGYYVDEHNFITTFFFIANYMRDRLTPIGFVVWEEASRSYVAGLSTEWKIDNHWSIKGGLNTIWGGTENFRHDSGPFRSFVVPGANGNNPFQESVFGVAHEGIGALRGNDELFMQMKYQF